jgi:hypothetical protein
MDEEQFVRIQTLGRRGKVGCQKQVNSFVRVGGKRGDLGQSFKMTGRITGFLGQFPFGTLAGVSHPGLSFLPESPR